jgi:(S)-ureidoglycine aminohydrolase
VENGPTPRSGGCAAAKYLLIRPDNLVPNALPHFEGTIVCPLATPRICGSRFGQYLLDFEASGGSVRPTGMGFENFLYQLEGEVVVEERDCLHTLNAGRFCFLPADVPFSIRASASASARTLWTKRRYEVVEDVTVPVSLFRHEAEVPEIDPPLPERYRYRALLPAADPSYDFAMNVMTMESGGSIGMVEIHHQEHGLFMLRGRGIYYLDGDWHEVMAGDYIYMAPYCPQSFRATGNEAASYLIYKDVNRDGF